MEFSPTSVLSPIDLAAFTGQSEIAAFLSNYYDSSKIKSKKTLALLSETNLAPANIALNHLKNIDKDALMDIYHNEPYPMNAKAAYLYHMHDRIQNCHLINVRNQETGVVNIKSYARLHAVSSNIHGAKPFQHQEIIKVLEIIAKKKSDFNQLLTELLKISENSYTDSALKSLEDFLCSIKMRKQNERCDLCFAPNAMMCCAECGTRYCSLRCQKLAWFDHKKWCLGIKHLNEDNINSNLQDKDGNFAGIGKKEISEIDMNELNHGVKLSKTGFEVR